MPLHRAAFAFVAALLVAPTAHAQHGARRHARPMPTPAPRVSGYARGQLDRCALGDAVACRVAGVHLARGDGGAARDGEAAAMLLERAWSLHRDEGCEWFFRLRSELPPNAVRRACDRGCGFACEARALHRLALDPADGQAEMERLCDRGGAHACYTLGHALLDGVLLPHDRRGALEHIGRACDLGGALACFEMTHEHWDAELLRARRDEVSPERLRATAPLSAPTAARRALAASRPSRPTPGALEPRRAARSGGAPTRPRSSPAAAR